MTSPPCPPKAGLVPLSTLWRGVHPEGETGGEVKKHKIFVLISKFG